MHAAAQRLSFKGRNGTIPSMQSLRKLCDAAELNLSMQAPRVATCSLRHTVHLTDTGRARLGEAARAQREAEDALFAGLDNNQREQLRQLLLSLRDGITTA